MTHLRGNLQTAQCKHCKMAFANCARKPTSKMFWSMKRSYVNKEEAQQTQRHSTFAECHLSWNLAVIQPLSHEQAFGLMTYSLICVRCDSQRHSDNKALSGKFRRRPSWCRQVTWQHSWAQRRNVTFSLRRFSPSLWQEWRCRVSKKR